MNPMNAHSIHQARREPCPTNAAARSLRRCAALALLAVGALCHAQPHERDFGPYTLRSSTVNTQNIAEETARQHGIERASDKAIINVTVLRKVNGVEQTVPAQVRVASRNLAGMTSDIEMHETTTGGYVSYMGTYEFLPREVLDFTVSAQPAGSSETLTITYRDRLRTN